MNQHLRIMAKTPDCGDAQIERIAMICIFTTGHAWAIFGPHVGHDIGKDDNQMPFVDLKFDTKDPVLTNQASAKARLHKALDHDHTYLYYAPPVYTGA